MKKRSLVLIGWDDIAATENSQEGFFGYRVLITIKKKKKKKPEKLQNWAGQGAGRVCSMPASR